MKTQNQRILEALRAGKRITPSYAMHHFRVYRLAARIAELRADGHQIVTDTHKYRSKLTGRPVAIAAYRLTDA